MNAPEIVVIDYGVGNLLSVQRGLEHCGAKAIFTANPEIILSAKRVILPGVGAFANAMMALNNLGLVAPIRELSDRKVPLLGICLGMQLLLEESNEFGITEGLGLIPGKVIAVPELALSGRKQKIPHIGWSVLQPSNAGIGWSDTLLKENRSGDAVYFVHSFMADPKNASHRIADCLYGGHKISAMIGRDHIVGCQFHPEKSGEVGLRILRRFCLD
jgi:imidazole glycerol-phosphate synthase subunit HisH